MTILWPCQAQQFMTEPVLAIEPSDHLDRAEVVMALAQARHIPVTSDGKLVGIIPLRDISGCPTRTPRGHPHRGGLYELCPHVHTWCERESSRGMSIDQPFTEEKSSRTACARASCGHKRLVVKPSKSSHHRSLDRVVEVVHVDTISRPSR